MKRIREQGTIETVSESAQERIDAIRQVVTDCQYAKIDGCMCDLFSANRVVQVYDALNDKNKAKFASVPWPKMAQIAFKLTA